MKMSNPVAVIAVCCMAVSVFVLIRSRIRMRKLINHMNRMIDRAIDGTFQAETIDESMLSALEFKLGRYLAAAETSARKMTEEKENIKTLISDISHQTKTPVASLLLYCELLQEQNLDGTSAEYVKAVCGQAEKLRFLVSTLVKMSRLETGILKLYPVCTEIYPMLAQACAQLAPKAEAKGLSCRLLFTEHEDCRACFDAKWTLEALCNILDNAVKYTDAGGITVRVIVYELFCCIEIADTGVGIREEEQAQIFSRFYRSSAAAGAPGVGIGLYLAREIVTEENGYIKLKSEPGRGSVFAVYLPRNQF